MMTTLLSLNELIKSDFTCEVFKLIYSKNGNNFKCTKIYTNTDSINMDRDSRVDSIPLQLDTSTIILFSCLVVAKMYTNVCSAYYIEYQEGDTHLVVTLDDCSRLTKKQLDSLFPTRSVMMEGLFRYHTELYCQLNTIEFTTDPCIPIQELKYKSYDHDDYLEFLWHPESKHQMKLTIKQQSQIALRKEGRAYLFEGNLIEKTNEIYNKACFEYLFIHSCSICSNCLKYSSFFVICCCITSLFCLKILPSKGCCSLSNILNRAIL